MLVIWTVVAYGVPVLIEASRPYPTEFASADVDDYESVAVRDIPSHRRGEPEEVAGMCAFLCSPAARYINGASLIADGGYYLGTWTPLLDPDV